MGAMTEIKVPDIGDFKDIPVIEILVKPGDSVKPEDPLLTLESDKATMEVPSPAAGTVRDLKVTVGDKVSEGTPILVLESAAGEGAKPAPAAAAMPNVSAAPPAVSAPAGIAEVRVPDIGDFKDIPVIELHVKPGDTVKAEDPLISLESDKATMEVPAPLGGVVQELRVKVGDKVSMGHVILMLVTDPEAHTSSIAKAQGVAAAAGGGGTPAAAREASMAARGEVGSAGTSAVAETPAAKQGGGAIDEDKFKLAYASPAVRKLARELAVDLGAVKGSGEKGRITKEDVEAFSKGATAKPSAAEAPAKAAAGTTSGTTVGGLELLPWPKVDFAKFGPIESKPLARIKKISGANLSRNWVMIPHVTNHEEADITEIEAFRVQMNKENEKSGAKVTMLAFMIKVAVACLKKFPEFNSSLDGDNLILKRYYHIGFAADTPNGLVVPVIRDADKKGVFDLAKETADLAKLARDGKLKPDQMQGGTFTISSLGGIGGTYFTPIINAPEVAIMGVCRSFMKPVWDGKEFKPRLILPLSLSWDHRVIDGAAAARFNITFANLLADMRRVLL